MGFLERATKCINEESGEEEKLPKTEPHTNFKDMKLNYKPGDRVIVDGEKPARLVRYRDGKLFKVFPPTNVKRYLVKYQDGTVKPISGNRFKLAQTTAIKESSDHTFYYKLGEVFSSSVYSAAKEVGFESDEEIDQLMADLFWEHSREIEVFAEEFVSKYKNRASSSSQMN